MPLHIGAIPETPEFHPLEEGWRPLKEPGPILMQFLALPFALVAFLALIPAWFPLVGHKIMTLDPATVLVIMLGIIPIHELIHAMVHPGQGRTSSSVIGVWPSRLLFYAHYHGSMSRDRFLAILLAPSIVLSLLPLPICYLARWAPPQIACLSIINGLFSCGDLLGFGLVAIQVPRRALVQNQGWATWWKIDEADPSTSSP